MAVANASAAVGLLTAEPGTSPSLAFVTDVFPLWVWAGALAAASVLQLLNRPKWGHPIAVGPWLMLAVGAVIGLVTVRTTAPAASVVFTALLGLMAFLHVNGMVYRRNEARARRTTQ